MNDSHEDFSRENDPINEAAQRFTDNTGFIALGLSAEVQHLRGGEYVITVIQDRYHEVVDGDAPVAVHGFFSDVEAFEAWAASLELMESADALEEIEVCADQYMTALAAGLGDWVRGSAALTRKPVSA